MKRFLLCMALVAMSCSVWAQRDMTSRYVTVQLSPDKADWTYKTGQEVTFNVAVMKDTYPQKNVEVEYTWGEETMTPTVTGKINTGDGYAKLKLKGLGKAGFMTLTGRVKIDGEGYSNFTNVAFEPEKIATTTKLPADFMQFWESVLAKSSKVPLESLMTLQPDLCTPYADVYHVRFQNAASGQYIYGMLSTPKAKGKYPAVLIVPGAGVRAYKGLTNYAKDGVIALQIGIHGIPVNLPDQLYLDLRGAALNGYNAYNIDNKDKYYYKNVYSGCVKAMDFLCSLPDVDTTRLAVGGGSQGGLLSLVVAGLDKRVKYLFANHPAYCNVSGYYNGSIGGWPKLFRDPKEASIEQKVKVSEYYDGTNFARYVTQPINFGISYNDQVCPPTSTWGTYNIIKSPKTMVITQDCGHWRYPEHYESQRVWLVEMLKK